MMIRLFRHDGLEVMLNIDMIKDIETGPPVVLTLIDGEKLQVKNTAIDVLAKIRACRKGKADEEREDISTLREKKTHPESQNGESVQNG